MKLLLVALSALAAACAPPAPGAPAPAAPAQTRTAPVGLGAYEGTYVLQWPDRVIDLRVWLDAQGQLNGELVEMGQRTTFRPSTGHRFLHATRDDVWFLFTVENGRATSVTMGHAGSQVSGPRRP